MNVYDETMAATSRVAKSTLKPSMRVVSVAAPPVQFTRDCVDQAKFHYASWFESEIWPIIYSLLAAK